MVGGYQETATLAAWPLSARVSVRRRARRPEGMPRISATGVDAATFPALTAVTALPGAGGTLAAGAWAVPWAAAAMRAAAPGATRVSRPTLGMAIPPVFMAPMTLEAVCMEMRQRAVIGRRDRRRSPSRSSPAAVMDA